MSSEKLTPERLKLLKTLSQELGEPALWLTDN